MDAPPGRAGGSDAVTGVAVVGVGVGRRRRRTAAGLSRSAGFEDPGGGAEGEEEEEVTSIAAAADAAAAREAVGIPPVFSPGWLRLLASCGGGVLVDVRGLACYFPSAGGWGRGRGRRGLFEVGIGWRGGAGGSPDLGGEGSVWGRRVASPISVRWFCFRVGCGLTRGVLTRLGRQVEPWSPGGFWKRPRVSPRRRAGSAGDETAGDGEGSPWAPGDVGVGWSAALVSGKFYSEQSASHTYTSM